MWVSSVLKWPSKALIEKQSHGCEFLHFSSVLPTYMHRYRDQKIISLSSRCVWDHGDLTLDSMWLQTMDGFIWSAIKEWLPLSACTCDAVLNSRLSGLIPSAQACQLHKIAHSLGNNMKSVVCHEGLENEFKKVWTAAGDGEEKIPLIWDPRAIRLWDPVLEYISALKVIFPRPCDWQKE